MRLTHLMTKRVFIARKVTTTGYRQAFMTVTADMMNIQPTALGNNPLADGVFGKSFKIYAEGGVDVQPGDRLGDEDGNYYNVVADGVTRRTMGSIDYLVISVEKTK